MYTFLAPTHKTVKPVVVWISGPSGCGKSRLAKSFKDAYTPHFCNNNIWCDGYDGFSPIVLDDFRATDYPFNQFL